MRQAPADVVSDLSSDYVVSSTPRPAQSRPAASQELELTLRTRGQGLSGSILPAVHVSDNEVLNERTMVRDQPSAAGWAERQPASGTFR